MERREFAFHALLNPFPPVRKNSSGCEIFAPLVVRRCGILLPVNISEILAG